MGGNVSNFQPHFGWGEGYARRSSILVSGALPLLRYYPHHRICLRAGVGRPFAVQLAGFRGAVVGETVTGQVIAASGEAVIESDIVKCSDGISVCDGLAIRDVVGSA